jgi:hypothetical protein
MSRRVPPGNGPFSSEVHRIGSLDASQESSCVVSITILCLTPCQVYPADGASSSRHGVRQGRRCSYKESVAAIC